MVIGVGEEVSVSRLKRGGWRVRERESVSSSPVRRLRQWGLTEKDCADKDRVAGKEVGDRSCDLFHSEGVARSVSGPVPA